LLEDEGEDEGKEEITKHPADMEACLGTWDLVSLGVGSCVGTGMYLSAGIVAATMAGPGGVVSLLVAGLASGLTGQTTFQIKM
jgi:cationic amino acid transporter 14